MTLEEDQIQDHEHGVTDPGHQHPYNDNWSPNGHCEHHTAKHECGEVVGHSRVTEESATGITVTGMNSGRHGTETRPKNMNVVFIMKVW